VRVKVGDAFDIVAERNKQRTTKVVVTGHMYEYAYEIKIRNHKDGPVMVIVNEPIAALGDGLFDFQSREDGGLCGAVSSAGCEGWRSDGWRTACA